MTSIIHGQDYKKDIKKDREMNHFKLIVLFFSFSLCAQACDLPRKQLKKVMEDVYGKGYFEAWQKRQNLETTISQCNAAIRRRSIMRQRRVVAFCCQNPIVLKFHKFQNNK